MDYRQYKMNWRDNVKAVFISLALALVVSQLFYDSWLGLAAGIPLAFFVRKLVKKKQMETQKTQLFREFLDGMQMVSNSLLSGASMENAWSEAEKEMAQLHGKDSLMCRELAKMNGAISVNETLEAGLEEFADRSGLEDVENFAEVFRFAKRSGGNLVEIIENTVYRMRAKLEVEQEIGVLVSAKRLEQKIMDAVPVLILGYLKLTSGDYLAVLYGNWFGVLFMTGALAAYAGAVFLSERILRIQL